MTSSQPQQPAQARTGRDRVAALAGMASVAVFAAGQYVAPALVWPEEQVGGVQRSFYALYEGRLLAEAILSGVAAGLFLLFLGGLWSLPERDGGRARPARVAVAPGSVTAGLVLLQAAVLAALVSLRGSELDVQAQGSAWAARALFYLQEAVGQVALFPFAVFLAAAAVSAGGALPRWLALAGTALAVVVGGLAAGSLAGLDIGPAGQLVFLVVSAFVAVLAAGVGWPLATTAGRREEAVR